MGYRIFGWSMAVMTACDVLLQVHQLDEELQKATTLRRVIVSKAPQARQKFCEHPSDTIFLQWREDGIWTDVCPGFADFSVLPRYWKLRVTYKYKLLFKWEIPITVSIVNLS